MQTYYRVNTDGIHKSTPEMCNLEIYPAPNHKIKQEFIQKYQLPQDIFYFDDMPEIAPRIESLQNKYLGDVLIFIISNVQTQKKEQAVEERLASHTFILGADKLFWFVDQDDAQMYQHLLEAKDDRIHSLESVIVHSGLLAYENFANELESQKRKIDDLHKLAVSSTSNRVLISAADTEKDMVLLQHTLEIQEIAFDKLLEDKIFISNLNNDFLVYDIKWYNRQVNQLVGVYRDLLDTTSSLFTDIMSNNLNQLMKFLNTLSLILAASTFVTGVWGMNTGGLPFGEHKYGTLIMTIVSLLAGLLMYLYLRIQDRSKY